ncbi:hypothetical protein V6N12_007354 [Hibiscus sabdariffa]|uniref:Uncharacterized protein n=1 Tax=Hibiscus sabdariffa TaxID=183260 RepID=A0ABR2F1I8_9ROSI
MVDDERHVNIVVEIEKTRVKKMKKHDIVVVSLTLPHVYEDLSGRKPDGIPSVLVPSALERTFSRTPLEG